MMQLPQQYYDDRRLEHFVENRTTYTAEHAELNIYETYRHRNKVSLQFQQPILASMVKGKKIMHLKDRQPFEFLPGESLFIPAHDMMEIDFPVASLGHPTQCLVMAIAPEKICKVIEDMNRISPKSDGSTWSMGGSCFSFTNDPTISYLLQRLLFLFSENHVSKDYFVDMNIRELIVRVLQAENLVRLSAGSSVGGSHRITTVIDYVRTHLHRAMTIKELSELACMSESNFHKVFKDELGISPVQFINRERVKKAAALLKGSSLKIEEIYLACGFTNPSYFIRIFKRVKGQTPGEYRASQGDY